MLEPKIIRIRARMANTVTAMAFPVMSKWETADEAKCTVFIFKETSDLLQKKTLLPTAPYSLCRCTSFKVKYERLSGIQWCGCKSVLLPTPLHCPVHLYNVSENACYLREQPGCWGTLDPPPGGWTSGITSCLRAPTARSTANEPVTPWFRTASGSGRCPAQTSPR